MDTTPAPAPTPARTAASTLASTPSSSAPARPASPSAYHLRSEGRRFVVLDGADRVGDSWRRRWDSLTLFTPRRYDALPGMTFPGDPEGYPGKDEVADYLDAYASQFDLPVRLGRR